jgi:hypothetical protein
VIRGDADLSRGVTTAPQAEDDQHGED